MVAGSCLLMIQPLGFCFLGGWLLLVWLSSLLKVTAFFWQKKRIALLYYQYQRYSESVLIKNQIVKNEWKRKKYIFSVSYSDFLSASGYFTIAMGFIFKHYGLCGMFHNLRVFSKLTSISCFIF